MKPEETSDTLWTGQKVEQQNGRCKLDATRTLYVPLAEFKKPNTVTTSPLLIEAPGDKRNLPMENSFEVALKR